MENPLGWGRGPSARGPHPGAGEAPLQARVGPPGVGPLALHPVGACARGLGGRRHSAARGLGIWVVGDRESNSALWDDVLHHLSGLGNPPHIVGAERHFPLGRLQDVMKAMLAHLLTRRLVDLDLEYAGSQECCQCGYPRIVLPERELNL